MSTQDEEIARHLREALASGELAGTKGFGEPFTEDEAWNATPESLRMPFKILRNAGFVPPEVELFHARAALTASLEASKSEQERAELLRKLKVKNSKATIALSGALVFALGLATGLTAQTLTDSPQRKEQKRTDLTGAPNMEVIASFVEIKPGESSNLHIHHGVEAFHVVQGASIQAPGQEPSVLATGFTSLNLRDVKHGAFKVVGDTPLKLLTVHIVDKDKPLYDYVK